MATKTVSQAQASLWALDNASDEDVLARALAILERRIRRAPVTFSSPSAVGDYLRLRIGSLEREVFTCLFLDAQNRLIEAEDLFHGTLTQTSVYPREVVRRALALNAAGVIFAHNHPSGTAEPSRADELLTQTLRGALLLVDVKVLDHFVVTVGATMSFAERGLL